MRLSLLPRSPIGPDIGGPPVGEAVLRAGGIASWHEQRRVHACASHYSRSKRRQPRRRRRLERQGALRRAVRARRSARPRLRGDDDRRHRPVQAVARQRGPRSRRASCPIHAGSFNISSSPATVTLTTTTMHDGANDDKQMMLQHGHGDAVGHGGRHDTSHAHDVGTAEAAALPLAGLTAYEAIQATATPSCGAPARRARTSSGLATAAAGAAPSAARRTRRRRAGSRCSRARWGSRGGGGAARRASLDLCTFCSSSPVCRRCTR